MSSDPSVDGIFSTSMAVMHILFSLAVLIGSSLKGFVSVNNRHCDFVASFPTRMTPSAAGSATSGPKLHRPQSTSSFLSTTPSDLNEDPYPVMLDPPRAPYTRKPLARSHETWPRWSVIEEEDEEAITPVITHDEQDQEEIPIQLLPPPPVLRRDDHAFYFTQEREFTDVGESGEASRFGVMRV